MGGDGVNDAREDSRCLRRPTKEEQVAEDDRLVL